MSSIKNKALEADSVNLRVFIEGVRIEYVNSVSVTSNGQTTTASISMPSSPSLRTEILTGAMVHIFYATSYELGKGHCKVKKRNADISDWPILFQGEVRGTSYSTNLDSTSTTLQCVTHARHYQQTLVHFVDPAKGSASDIGLLQNRIEYHGNKRYIFESAKNSTVTYTSRMLTRIKNRSELVVKDSMENIGFSSIINEILYAGDSSASYRIFNKKLRLNSRVSSFIDPDIKKLVGIQQFADLVDNKIRKMPAETSLHQLMGVASGLLKYDWLHISQPKFAKGKVVVTRYTREGGSGKTGLKAFEFKNVEYTEYSGSSLEKSAISKGLVVEVPTNWSDRPLERLEGIVLQIMETTESILTRQAFVEFYETIGTDGLSRIELPRDYWDRITNSATVTRTMTAAAFIDKVLRMANSFVDDNGYDQEKALDEAVQTLLFRYFYIVPLPESERGKDIFDFKGTGPDITIVSSPRRAWHESPAKPIDNYSEFKKVSNIAHLNHKDRKKKEPVDNKDKWTSLQKTLKDELKGRKAGIAEFIAVPNLDFAQPPRCNVIAPTGINNFGIQIDHFAAPTRLYGLASILDNTNKRLPKWYIAPLSVFYRVERDTGLPLVWKDAYQRLGLSSGRNLKAKNVPLPKGLKLK